MQTPREGLNLFKNNFSHSMKCMKYIFTTLSCTLLIHATVPVVKAIFLIKVFIDFQCSAEQYLHLGIHSEYF